MSLLNQVRGYLPDSDDDMSQSECKKSVRFDLLNRSIMNASEFDNSINTSPAKLVHSPDTLKDIFQIRRSMSERLENTPSFRHEV